MCYHAFWAKNQAQPGRILSSKISPKLEWGRFAVLFSQNWPLSCFPKPHSNFQSGGIYIYIYISHFGWSSLHMFSCLEGLDRIFWLVLPSFWWPIWWPSQVWHTSWPAQETKMVQCASRRPPQRIQILGIFCPHSDVCCFISPLSIDISTVPYTIVI